MSLSPTTVARVNSMTLEKSRQILQIIAKAEDKGFMSASEGMRESLYKARRKPKCNESYAAVCKVLDECRLFAGNAGL